MERLIKSGQGRTTQELLAVWPGLFRIGFVGLLITAAVLAAHVIEKRNASLATLAQLKSSTSAHLNAN